MIKKNSWKKLKTVLENSNANIIKVTAEYMDKGVRRSLTNQYLGVATGELRNKTGVSNLTKTGFHLGTTDYGMMWEDPREISFNQVKVKISRQRIKDYRRKRALKRYKGANERWKGRKKRPFLRDTVQKAARVSRTLIKRADKL